MFSFTAITSYTFAIRLKMTGMSIAHLPVAEPPIVLYRFSLRSESFDELGFLLNI